MASQTPRPALSRAADADLHPVSGRPLPAPVPGGVKEGKGKSTSLKPGKGATSADALTGPPKDKYVDLGARVPKSVRKRLRAEAKAQGVAADDLLSRILDAYLP
ncbi:MAG: hypothetical protein FJW85_05910 [Actinobacteria bacterium]|nr:hypothetical protein [Actinomycetota bacterium]